MPKMTSIHICAAKYGAEKHNRREKEMKHVHPEYSHLNKSWESPGFKSVADEIRKAKERYETTHFCRKAAINEDGKRIWMPDTSKHKKMPKNAHPIREGVAVITPNTTMEQMLDMARLIEERWGIRTIGIWAHLDEGHEHLVTDKDHRQGKYLDTPEGETIFIWNYHAHYLFDWTDHDTGQCINLNRHDMSELQDILANTFNMERGKKSDKKWRDAHAYKAEQEQHRAKEAAEYVEHKKAQAKQIVQDIMVGEQKLSKLQASIDELLSATNIQEEDMQAVPFAEMPFKMQGSDKPYTVKDLVDEALYRISKDLSKPIPMLGRDKWLKERNVYAKQVTTILQEQLNSVSRIHRKKINEMGKLMYFDAKKKAFQAVRMEQENEKLRQRISELDEKAVAREKARADAAERKAREQVTRAESKTQEQSARADWERLRADEAEKRLSMTDRFLHLPNVYEAYKQWTSLFDAIENAIKSFNAWAHNSASIFSDSDEQSIGQGIIAYCQLNNLDPYSEKDRQTAASGIAKEAESTVGHITQFMWDIAVTRIGQLASEMCLSRGSQSIGGSNGYADELTNWDGTKKRGLGR